MSWVCPNCSSSNPDEEMNCFVCGMDRPSAADEPASDPGELKVVFSVSEAVRESVKNLFRRQPDRASEKTRAEKPPKPAKTERTRPPRPARDKTKAIAASSAASEFAAPWPEHRIEFDLAAIRAKGFVRSEQKSLGGVNGYNFYKEDGAGQFIRMEMLLIQKMARMV